VNGLSDFPHALLGAYFVGDDAPVTRCGQSFGPRACDMMMLNRQ
jgi:hypothetical protein